jgi:carboxypeptidase Taq
MSREAYSQLTKVFARLHRFNHLAAITQWDAMVNMPPKGAAARAEALSELDLVTHGVVTAPEVSTLLTAAAADTTSFTGIEVANLREMNRLWKRESKLPEDVVKKKAIVTSNAEQAWRKFRPQNNWTDFVPYLRDVFELSKEIGFILSKGTNLTPYEALLDLHEPDLRVSTIDSLFNDIITWLPELILKVRASQRSAKIPSGPFPISRQRELGLMCMRLFQFDFDAGRLDVSSHPFCGGVPEDVRLTTRYTESGFDQSLMGIIHETGHAKYEQNRPRDLISQPVSAARSMGIHESQSLFAEMQIGRSAPFVRYLAPKIAEQFGPQEAFTAENLLMLYRSVEPGYIRVDADELCYPLHVILRCEIERAVVEGSLAVDDIPAAWSEKMQRYLQLSTAGNFKDGCMQDIHWSIGAVGYFPSYVLGAIYAAQFMAAMRRDLGGNAAVDAMIESGDLAKILQWQRERIWSQGSLFTTAELVRRATGSEIDLGFYRKHLTERYLS